MIDVKQFRRMCGLDEGKGRIGIRKAEMRELLDRLEAAERYAVEWERLAWQCRGERDALAAHVEELNRDWVAHWDDCNSLCAYGDGRCSCGLANVQESKSDTSLARLRGEIRHQVAEEWALGLPGIIAEKQAEALEKVLSELRRVRRDEPTVKAMDAAIDAVIALRRQAEGGES